MPDDALRACINDALGQTRTDPVTEEQMQGLTDFFDCAPISDLTGLEYATSITSIGINPDPSLYDLSPLSGLTQLTRLGFMFPETEENGSITDLSPLAGLTELSLLQIPYQQISSLEPIAGLKNLTRVILINNQITSLVPLAGSSSTLQTLGVSDNPLDPSEGLSALSNMSRLSSVSQATQGSQASSPCAGFQSAPLSSTIITSRTSLQSLMQGFGARSR